MPQTPRTLLIVLATLALVFGWWLSWFLCDDAFIAFRYVSNSQLGHGYVWNAPPFHAVEGYSSFLWVVLLDIVWTLTGVQPPQSANTLGLLFGLVQLATIVALFDRIELVRMAPWRNTLLGLTLLAVLTNRTFLSWLSGGLETPLFDALILLWLLAAVDRRIPVLAGLAALLELARPDGWLYVLATIVLAVLVRRPAALWPLALAFVHEGWRIWRYQALLPNTYYAKVDGWWPEMGLAYLAAFLLDYGFWLWIPVAFYGLRALPKIGRDRETLVRTVIFGTLVMHFLYYTFRVGGDHFGFRVYAWTVPLIALGSVLAVEHLPWRPTRAVGFLVAVWLVGLPLPWTHWLHTHDVRDRDTQKERGMPIFQLAPKLVGPFWPIARARDELTRAMFGHFIAITPQDHLIYLEYQRSRFPDREEGSKVDGDLIVMSHNSVGWPSWTLPHVNIIDGLGLNDAIIARNPERGRSRRMAHNRLAPKGYVKCFQPNLTFTKDGTMQLRERRLALTDDDVRACEAQGWKSIGASTTP